jgi:hypothetical protein
VPVSLQRQQGRQGSVTWEREYSKSVREAHQRRVDYMLNHFPAAYLEHMKSCAKCGKLKVFTTIVEGLNLPQITPDFCSKTIDFLEERVFLVQSEDKMDQGGWKGFEKALESLVEVPEFPRVYFKHALGCTRKCGSWRTFQSIAQRKAPLQVADLRAAMEFVNTVDLRGVGDNLRRPARRYQGLQLLVRRCSQLEPEFTRTRLLEALFCMTADQESARHSRPPFLDDQPFFDVTPFGKVNCGAETLKKIAFHAERRVKFQYKLFVAVFKDRFIYRAKPAFFGCGVKGGENTQLLHSAITANVDRKRNVNDAWDLCKKGRVFYSHRFLEEINHTIALDAEYNVVDSWIEDKFGDNKGVRGLMNGLLNGCSFAKKTPLEVLTEFMAHLFASHKAAAFQYSDETKKLEYVCIHQWIYDKIAPVNAEGVRQIDTEFLRYCAREDLGAEYVVDPNDLDQLFTDWQKKLLEE